MSARKPPIAVVGGASADAETAALAFQVGRGIVDRGGVVLCGGRSGVMEHAARGAAEAGGQAVGILPGRNARESPPNPHLSLALFTGLGQARNQVLVLSAGAVIAIGGGWGTVSEIALASKHGIPVVALGAPEIRFGPASNNPVDAHPDASSAPDSLPARAASAAEAVDLAFSLLETSR